MLTPVPALVRVPPVDHSGPFTHFHERITSPHRFYESELAKRSRLQSDTQKRDRAFGGNTSRSVRPLISVRASSFSFNKDNWKKQRDFEKERQQVTRKQSANLSLSFLEFPTHFDHRGDVANDKGAAFPLPEPAAELHNHPLISSGGGKFEKGKKQERWAPLVTMVGLKRSQKYDLHLKKRIEKQAENILKMQLTDPEYVPTQRFQQKDSTGKKPTAAVVKQIDHNERVYNEMMNNKDAFALAIMKQYNLDESHDSNEHDQVLDAIAQLDVYGEQRPRVGSGPNSPSSVCSPRLSITSQAAASSREGQQRFLKETSVRINDSARPGMLLSSYIRHNSGSRDSIKANSHLHHRQQQQQGHGNEHANVDEATETQKWLAEYCHYEEIPGDQRKWRVEKIDFTTPYRSSVAYQLKGKEFSKDAVMDDFTMSKRVVGSNKRGSVTVNALGRSHPTLEKCAMTVTKMEELEMKQLVREIRKNGNAINNLRHAEKVLRTQYASQYGGVDYFPQEIKDVTFGPRIVPRIDLSFIPSEKYTVDDKGFAKSTQHPYFMPVTPSNAVSALTGGNSSSGVAANSEAGRPLTSPALGKILSKYSGLPPPDLLSPRSTRKLNEIRLLLNKLDLKLKVVAAAKHDAEERKQFFDAAIVMIYDSVEKCIKEEKRQEDHQHHPTHHYAHHIPRVKENGNLEIFSLKQSADVIEKRYLRHNRRDCRLSYTDDVTDKKVHPLQFGYSLNMKVIPNATARPAMSEQPH